MYQFDQWLLKCLVWAIVITAALTVFIALYFDVDGWGTFAWSWGAPLLAQAAVALTLSGALLTILRAAFRHLFNFFLSRLVLLGLFLATAVLALPFLAIVFNRPVDVYDAIQTGVLVIAFSFLTKPAKRFLKRFEPKDAGKPVPPQKQRPVFRPAPATDGELYQNLLAKVMGDRETAERLIEYERGSAPRYASRDELVRRAIERWERDNQ
jgi:hypothetical protein